MPALSQQPIRAALALTLLRRVRLQPTKAPVGTASIWYGGCFSCHTAAGGQPLAGGRALAIPFGTFYSPNITPDPDPAVRQDNRPHDVAFPFSWRVLQTGWKLLFFTPGPFQPDPERSAAYNRGAYLVTALAHCGECHTPRNFFGATRSDQRLSGTSDGPDGQLVPNITPDPGTGIGKWKRVTLSSS